MNLLQFAWTMAFIPKKNLFYIHCQHVNEPLVCIDVTGYATESIQFVFKLFNFTYMHTATRSLIIYPIMTICIKAIIEISQLNAVIVTAIPKFQSIFKKKTLNE